MSSSSKEAILAAARRVAQARGYGGLNFRELADEVGIKHASIYYHFPGKADLGVAVARRYREDNAVALQDLAVETGDPAVSLRRYPETFRMALTNDNRMCLASFMSAEYDDLPESIRGEIQAFADINVTWLADRLVEAGLADPQQSQDRARAIFAAVSGAQLMARSRADLSLFDRIIENYQCAGLLPM
ncbi:TetR/AcrR family transcriptional regulator [Sphingomonas sp.]|uniref:TetR/AcrR family transcriptional regulator n=1 Tax=Sphingomonas sp. TaxID=28214 RepID=UPI000DB1493E|nr:TetR/AcrR family transcriptional regulator [Sphingomonas sp.]PZU06782.1 MAG: TetR family transcriptional regulator [Sphingomonas sp.]